MSSEKTITGYIRKALIYIRSLLASINKRPKTFLVTVLTIISYMPLLAIWKGNSIDSLNEWFSGGVPVILFIEVLDKFINLQSGQKTIGWLVLATITFGCLYLFYNTLKYENKELKK